MKEDRPFAMLSAQLLRKLGGKYKAVAEKLEASSERPSDSLDTTSTSTDVQKNIAELEKTLTLSLPDSIREVIEQELTRLRAMVSEQQEEGTRATFLRNRRITKYLDIARSEDSLVVETDGQVIGVNAGIAIAVFGEQAQEEERRQLGWYLGNLVRQFDRLPLQGIEQRASQHARIMTLTGVYTMLATRAETTRQYPVADITDWFTDSDFDTLKKKRHPDYALPDTAVLRWNISMIPPNPTAAIGYALRATQAVADYRRLVLLGDPGSGKSTFVRHLALLVARRALDEPVPVDALPTALTTRLPLLLPLQQLARALAAQPHQPPAAVVADALAALLHTAGCDLATRIVTAACQRGSALLLFDGLDEVPLDGSPGEFVGRAATAAAVQEFVTTRVHPDCPVVLTCRVRAFTDDLRASLGWAVETLAPFTLGQVRHFVPAWYRELAAVTGMDAATVDHYSGVLIETIATSHQLREMAQTPLLLTMIALVLYNMGELPRDRPQLYERILDVLLGQWDKAGQKGGTLGEAIGLPDCGSKRFLPLLDRLSYEAHRTASSADGRGRLAMSAILTELITFFKQAKLPQAEATAKAGGFLDYIEQRSGLLSPDADGSYVFAHLTLQEHCAGRYIVVGSEDPVALVQKHRADDRWCEPIMLGLGLAHPADLDDVLEFLREREEQGAPKPAARWYRDLLFAAEIGADRDWHYLRTLPRIKVARHQERLRQGLATLLSNPASGLEQRERIRAGVLLGELGDPRFPVTLEQWRVELMQRNTTFGQPHGYLCYIPGGSYAVGGWGEDVRNQPNTPAAQHKLKPYWIARYPITNAQFRPFVEGDGYTNEGYWTPDGWAWRTELKHTAPTYWDDARFNQPNQPVVGVAWYDAMAYAAWLTQRLADELPDGYELRLPTEAEWEVAAAYDGQGTRRHYPWGDGPEPDGDHAIFADAQGNNLGAAAPVGVCAAGVAACGADDMSGNVFEWCASSCDGYPQAAATFTKDGTDDDFGVPLRGGSWYFNSRYIPCISRNGFHPISFGGISYYGVRVVCAPRQA